MDTKAQKRDDMAGLSPEEIKAIGQIEIGPSKHEIFLNNHYKKLLWGGIALGLIGGAIIAYVSHSNDTRDYAAARLMSAMNVRTPGAIVSPSFYNSSELSSVQTEYAQTPAAATAKLMEGLRLFSTGNAGQGAPVLEAVAADVAHPVLASRALVQLASHAMENKDDAKAAGYWKSVLELGSTPYATLACMSLGDIARSQGDTEQARKYYEQAIADYPGSQLVRGGSIGLSVEVRRQLLNVDYPLPVAPAPKPAAQPMPQPTGNPALPALPELPSTLPGTTNTSTL